MMLERKAELIVEIIIIEGYALKAKKLRYLTLATTMLMKLANLRLEQFTLTGNDLENFKGKNVSEHQKVPYHTFQPSPSEKS